MYLLETTSLEGGPLEIRDCGCLWLGGWSRIDSKGGCMGRSSGSLAFSLFPLYYLNIILHAQFCYYDIDIIVYIDYKEN